MLNVKSRVCGIVGRIMSLASDSRKIGTSKFSIFFSSHRKMSRQGNTHCYAPFVTAMAILQPELNLNPVVDIWPLLAADYSSCALLIINDKEILDISAIPKPLILRDGINRHHSDNSSRLVMALISVQCLLHVLALVPGADESDLEHKFSVTKHWKFYHAVYPHTNVILSTEDHSDFVVRFLYKIRKNLFYWPEVFMIQPNLSNTATGNDITSRRSFSIKFFCWYCRSESKDEYSRVMPLDIFQASCGEGSITDCRNVMKRTVEANLFDFGAQFWTCLKCAEMSGTTPYNPFGTGLRKPGNLYESVVNFLHRTNGTRLEFGLYFPTFREARFDYVLKISNMGFKGSFYPAGQTSAVKFVTLEGVVDVKSSPNVYFAPFTPQVWCIILVSAWVTWYFEIIFERVATKKWPSLSVVFELFYCKIASFAGQYPQGLMWTGQESPKVYTQGIMIAAAVWLLSSTIIIINYGAFYSAESLRTFPFSTKYKYLMELENFTLFYLVSEERYAALWGRGTPTFYKTMIVKCSHIRNFSTVQECEFANYITILRWYYFIKEVEMNESCQHRNRFTTRDDCQSVSAMHEVRKISELLRNFEQRSYFVLRNHTEVEKILEEIRRKGTPAAFVTADYEFQHSWEVFTKIMGERPGLKIANNFHSDDKFSVQEFGYWFRSGMHKRYRRRFEGRLQTLLSSGIYGLWTKWHKFRLAPHGLRYGEVRFRPANGLPGAPMSFDNSALSWVFWAQTLGWLAFFGIFLTEVALPLHCFGIKSCVAKGFAVRPHAHFATWICWETLIFGRY